MREYASELTAYIDVKCEHNMTVNDIDCVIYKKMPSGICYIKIIKSKHI